jgi:REase_AHJR-like
MTLHSNAIRSAFVSKIAQKYQQDGYAVVFAPKPNELPFDLGLYKPDLLVKKSDKEGYIVEVKNSVNRIPVDRYREIAETVSQHHGWRFLLITDEDTVQANQNKKDDLLSWEQIVHRKEQGERLLTLGEVEGAFSSLWGALEALLRNQAEKLSIPIERFPTLSLIKHLYSQGELSIEQYDTTMALFSVRNQFVHGYQTPGLADATRQLADLVHELLDLWQPHPTVA